ncbi:uncharacterized protein [Euphorbia lathyris]|uniref:uncharacterized protein isoform X2 n=1 Tax=Euphorbia lathyris TaxID=212925 RepID=UPI0033140FF7
MNCEIAEKIQFASLEVVNNGGTRENDNNTTPSPGRSQQLGDFGCCNSIWGFLDSSMKNSTYLKWQSMLLIYVQLLVAGVRNVQLQVLSCKLYLPAKLSQDSRLWKSKVVLQLAPSLQQQPFKIIVRSHC